MAWDVLAAWDLGRGVGAQHKPAVDEPLVSHRSLLLSI